VSILGFEKKGAILSKKEYRYLLFYLLIFFLLSLHKIFPLSLKNRRWVGGGRGLQNRSESPIPPPRIDTDLTVNELQIIVQSLLKAVDKSDFISAGTVLLGTGSSSILNWHRSSQSYNKKLLGY
jgi:hypothetical protein